MTTHEEEDRELGYLEVVENQCKIIAGMLNETRGVLVDASRHAQAVWSLAGRAVIATRSAGVLNTMVDSWADMVTVGRTVFECALAIKVLAKDPVEGPEMFWQHAEARMFERNRMVLDGADSGRHMLKPDERTAMGGVLDGYRQSYEAVRVQTRDGEYIPSRWYKKRSTKQLAADVGFASHYRWWFAEASDFAHASPVSAVGFLRPCWQAVACRKTPYLLFQALSQTVAPELSRVFDLRTAQTVAALGLFTPSLGDWPKHALREQPDAFDFSALRPDLAER